MKLFQMATSVFQIRITYTVILSSYADKHDENLIALYVG